MASKVTFEFAIQETKERCNKLVLASHHYRKAAALTGGLGHRRFLVLTMVRLVWIILGLIGGGFVLVAGKTVFISIMRLIAKFL